MRDAAHKQAQPRSGNHEGHACQHGERKHDDGDAVVWQREIGQQRNAATHPAGVFHAHVLRTEQAAHGLLQHQADAEGGQQSLQRAAVEEANHTALQNRPNQCCGQKGDRNGHHQIPAKSRLRHKALKQQLHHIRGIGADHDQLTMRHVDDAHQAVSNGQAQRSQQQHRAQTDAAENGAQPVAPGQAIGNTGQCRLDGFLHTRVGLFGKALVQQKLCLRRLLMRELLHRLQALRHIVATQQARRHAALQQGLDLFIFLGGKRFFQQRQTRCIRLGCQLLCGSAAGLHIAAAQRQRGLCRVDHGAQIVIADHFLGIRRKCGGLTCHRVGRCIATHHIDLALRHAHLIAGEGAEICHQAATIGLYIRRQHSLIDGQCALLCVICSSHGIGLFSCQCVTGKAHQ